MANRTSKSNSGDASRRKAPSSAHALFGSSTRKTGLDANWSDVDPVVLHNIVWAVDFFGGAVTFSTTKSGAAYCIKVYMGQPFDPMYFDGDAEGRAEMVTWAERLVQTAAEES